MNTLNAKFVVELTLAKNMQFGKVLLLKMAKTENLVSPSDHTVRVLQQPTCVGISCEVSLCLLGQLSATVLQFFVGCDIARYLTTTPHPMDIAGRQCFFCYVTL